MVSSIAGAVAVFQFRIIHTRARKSCAGVSLSISSNLFWLVSIRRRRRRRRTRNNEQIYHTLARQVPLQLMDLECLKRLVADREKQTKEKEEAQRKRDLLKIQQMELKQQEQQLRLQEQQQQLQSSYAYLENKTVSSGLLK